MIKGLTRIVSFSRGRPDSAWARASRSFTRRIRRCRGGFGAGAGPPPSLAYEDLAEIKEKVTGINGISADQRSTQDVKGGNTTLEDISIIGTIADFTAARGYRVAEGRSLTDKDNDRTNKVAVLGADIAQGCVFPHPTLADGG